MDNKWFIDIIKLDSKSIYIYIYIYIIWDEIVTKWKWIEQETNLIPLCFSSAWLLLTQKCHFASKYLPKNSPYIIYYMACAK
jgi:hypothetical protein